MAKDKFERTKPHVNVTARKLIDLGISSTGAYQAARALNVSNPRDRERLAEILAATTPGKGDPLYRVTCADVVA